MFGIIVAIPGIKIKTASAIMAAKIKYSAYPEISSTLTPAILDATKRLIPIGGVICPIAKLTTINIPNQIGLNPNCPIIGINIGKKNYRKIDIASRNIPANRSSTFIMAIISRFEWTELNKKMS